jgi:hypothetical protein
LIHLNAQFIPVWQYGPNLREMPVSASTMLVIIIGVLIFAAFAGSLAWAQLHARPARITPVIRPKRRPF